MYSFRSFLKDLNRSTGMDFNIYGDDGINIYNGDSYLKNSEVLTFSVLLGKNKAFVSVSKKYEMCIPLLKYSIENKYSEIFSMRERFLVDILEGKEVSVDEIQKSMPFLSKGCVLLLINVDGSRYEALNIIRQIYTEEQDVMTAIYRDNIIAIGNFEEVEEHARSIRDSIASDLYCKCYISYGSKIFAPDSIFKAYNEAKECMLLGRKFGLKEDVFDYNRMLFEKIVFNIKQEVKNNLLDQFKEKFNLFDGEMLNTIEEFINCDLNISDAARRLYIHRNTLIYRLDKISKETGFDIRNFKEATVFIIAFLVWKENK